MDATEKKQPNQYLCEFVIELMLNAKKKQRNFVQNTTYYFGTISNIQMMIFPHNLLCPGTFKRPLFQATFPLSSPSRPWPRCSTATAPTSRSHPRHWFPWHPIPPPYPVRSGQECCEPMNQCFLHLFVRPRKKHVFLHVYIRSCIDN